MSYELNTVHFNVNRPDFGRLPRRASIGSIGEYDARPAEGYVAGEYSHSELDGDRERQREEKRTEEVRSGLKVAETHVAAGRFAAAREIYKRLASRFGWSGNLRDLVETALESEAAAGNRPPELTLARTLPSYLQGMAAYEDHRFADANALFESVYHGEPAGSQVDFLRARALYQQASIAYEWFDFRRALELYQQLLHEFPKSNKREAALIMIARCAILPATDEGRQVPAGETALASLRREFPASRFRSAAKGLQARVDLLEERYSKALSAYLSIGDTESIAEICRSLSGPALQHARVDLLAAYMRRLNAAKSYTEYEWTIAGINRIKRHLARQEIVQFHKRLLSDPDTAAAYLYYCFCHTDSHAADTKRLAQIAETIATRFPAAKLSSFMQVGIAEIYYRQGRYDRALSWCTRCLEREPHYDRALYARGAALHRMGRLREAGADFDALLKYCSNSGLRPAAHEEAALIAEDAENWSSALSHYFALDYHLDQAYLLDVRMPAAAIESYIHTADARESQILATGWRTRDEGKQTVCKRSELAAYSLGIRYMRDEKWDLAERWLKSIPTALYRAFSRGRAEWEDPASPEPLKAVHDLRKLHEAVQRAGSPRARAQAMFRYGSYYYQHGTLLLYNCAMWRGERSESFGLWWSDIGVPKRVRTAVRSYMYRHETFARTLSICLAAYEENPSAPIAPQALYRAACASRKLANMNSWWREEDHHRNHWLTAVQLMKRFARRYPHHPLAAEARKYARVFKEEGRDNQ